MFDAGFMFVKERNSETEGWTKIDKGWTMDNSIFNNYGSNNTM